MLHLVIGSLYQWGIINIYVTSYFKTLDPSVTLESNAIAFPLMMFCIGMTMRLGIFFADKTHPLIALVTSTIAFSASAFVSSYMTQIWGFFFFYGILFGLLDGLIFMIPVVECNKYFPGKKNVRQWMHFGWNWIGFNRFRTVFLQLSESFTIVSN